jgi:4-hydroxy-tetrahydrodipicolinate reductase
MNSAVDASKTTGSDRRYRVAQWATGKVGSKSLKGVIQHPVFDLAGLYVHSAAKEGRDAGELCGLAPVGISATRNIDDIIASQPDCVLYMQEGYNLDDICRLLEAGINIVTTRGEFFYPARMDPSIRGRTEAACRQGGSSLHATGSSPGFITEALPLVLTSVARRLDCLTIDEFAYIPESCSTEMIFDVMGYGRPAGAGFDPNLLGHMAQCFDQSLSMLADTLSLTLDSVEASGETATATRRIELAGGAFLEQGTVAAQRITVAGMRNGSPLLRFRANWFCATEIDPGWTLGETGWRVTVEGDTPFDIRIEMPRTSEGVAEQMGGYTAHRAVNSVPYVVAAPPGIVTTADLPQVIARLGPVPPNG